MSQSSPFNCRARVPSWAVTSAMLASWGFTVEVRDHVVGCQTVDVKGMPFGKALHEAWGAGFVTHRSEPEWRKEQRAQEREAERVEGARHQAEAFAWVATQRQRTCV